MKRTMKKARNLDMVALVQSGKGGAHRNSKDKRQSNKKNNWRFQDMED